MEAFDETLKGMDASVPAVIAAIEGDHVAFAQSDLNGESVEFSFSLRVEPDAVFIPASDGCDLDTLELEIATRFATQSGDSADGEWNFSLSAATAEENGGRLDPSQAALVLAELGLTAPEGEELSIGIGACFVSVDDPAQASFEGYGTISTVGGPNKEPVVLARFTWDE